MEATLRLDPGFNPVLLFGAADEVLRTIERGFHEVDIHVRSHDIAISGPAGEVALAQQLLEELYRSAREQGPLSADAVGQAINLLRTPTVKEEPNLDILSVRGKTIRPKTMGQKEYVDAIDANTIVFAVGPAGTGKTYLAMAKAVYALLNGDVRRIILTRPAVEAGESLGYLPGSLTEKIDPYLRPLFDALHDMLDPQALPSLMAAGTIEVAPLAYMRGRTLNDAFIILDEAQNTTPAQMKMFLTRLGFNSRVVVTGDTTQIDLAGGQRSGLRVVQEILADLPDIHFAHLTSADVVRHRLVGQIIDAYARWDVENAVNNTKNVNAVNRSHPGRPQATRNRRPQ